MFVRIRELFAGVLNKQQVSQNNVEFFERNISFAIAHTVLKNKKKNNKWNSKPQGKLYQF